MRVFILSLSAILGSLFVGGLQADEAAQAVLRKNCEPFIKQMSSRFLDEREAGVQAVFAECEGDRTAVLPLMLDLLAEEAYPLRWSAAQVLRRCGEDVAPVRGEIASRLAKAARDGDWATFELTRTILLSMGDVAHDTVPTIAREACDANGNIARSCQKLLTDFKGGENRPPDIAATEFEAVEGGSAVFEMQVSDSDDLPGLVEVEVTEQPALGQLEQEGARVFSYSCPLGTAGDDTFACRAKDASGGVGESRTFKVSVKPDTTAPRIVRVLAAGVKDRVIVTFSKPVRAESAEDTAAYGIDNGVQVLAAERRKDPSQVKLTTSVLRENVEYTLKVDGVRDVTKTGNAVVDTARFAFSKGQPGIACKYYELEGKTPSTPQEFDAMEPSKVGVVATIEPSLRERDTYFALRFDGFVAVARAGDYEFFLTADDEGCLYIDGQQVAAKDEPGKVRLNAGMHAVCLTYAQHAWAFDLKLEWSGPGTERQEVPEEVLFHGE